MYKMPTYNKPLAIMAVEVKTQAFVLRKTLVIIHNIVSLKPPQ
jgi:hypothetical protein